MNKARVSVAVVLVAVLVLGVANLATAGKKAKGRKRHLVTDTEEESRAASQTSS